MNDRIVLANSEWNNLEDISVLKKYANNQNEAKSVQPCILSQPLFWLWLLDDVMTFELEFKFFRLKIDFGWVVTLLDDDE